MPYQLARQTVEVRATARTIEIFHQGKRIASHLRTAKVYAAVTDSEHRPAAHRAHLDWPPSRLIQWASTRRPANPASGRDDTPSPAASGDGLSILPGHPAVGAALSAASPGAGRRTRLAHRRGQLSKYALIRDHSPYQQPVNPPAEPRSVAGHDNIRGAAYFQ